MNIDLVSGPPTRHFAYRQFDYSLDTSPAADFTYSRRNDSRTAILYGRCIYSDHATLAVHV